MNTRSLTRALCSGVALAWCLLLPFFLSRSAEPSLGGAGTLDTGFFASRGVEPSWDGTPTVRRILPQPDGRIVILGGFDTVQDFRRPGLARLLENGSLDRGFVPPALEPRDVALEPDGRLILADNTAGLIHLNEDGTLDTTFEGRMQWGATAVVRLSSGELLAAGFIDKAPENGAPRYGVMLFDAQGSSSSRWSTDYRSSAPISFLLLDPREKRLIVDGSTEIALDSTGANYHSLTNVLPAGFRPICGAFQTDGKLLLGRAASVGGNYNTNDTLASPLLRLHGDGTLDSTFSPMLTIGVSAMEGAKSEIRIDALAVQSDGRILIGGYFTQAHGTPRSLVARLLPDGELDTEFVPDLQVNPGVDIDALQTVSAMGLTTDGRLLIGGVFSRINGIECRTLARLHTSATTSGGTLCFAQSRHEAWETNATLAIEVVRSGPTNTAVSVFYESPELTSGAPVSAPLRGKLVFAPGEDRRTIALSVRDNSVLDGNHAFRLVLSNPGGGAVLTGKPETEVVILDDEQVGRPGSVDTSYPALATDGTVYNVIALAAEEDGSALVSVQFATNTWSYQTTVLRLSPTGLVDPNFQVVTDQAVTAAFPDPVTGKILISGSFTQVNGQECALVARLNHDGTLDTVFHLAADAWISGSLVQPDGKIVIFGYFTSVNGVPRQQIARLNSEGAVDPEFDTSTLGHIGLINGVESQPDGKVLVRGSFNQIGGLGRTNLARLNRDGSVDSDFAPSAFREKTTVYNFLCQPDGKILVSGSFIQPSLRSAAIIRLQTNGAPDATFSAAIPEGIHGRSLLLQPDGKIIVDGKWRLHPDGSRDSGFFTGEESAYVNAAVLLSDGSVLASGTFITFDQRAKPYLVHLLGGDASAPGYFELPRYGLGADEDNGPVYISVRRIGPTNEVASFAFTTMDGSARAGVDYEAVSGFVSLLPGQTVRIITIPILGKTTFTGPRAFSFVLQDTTPGLRGLSMTNCQINIFENEPSVTFDQPGYWVAGEAIPTDGAGWRLEYLHRYGSWSEPLTVQCQLVADSAVPGQDFVLTNLTIHFAANQYQASVVLPLINNPEATQDRTVLLVLNNPNPGLSLGLGSTALLTIGGPARTPGFFVQNSSLDTAGTLHLPCDLRPNQYLEVESSTNLVDWICAGWVYRDDTQVTNWFNDPDAWKSPQRFYRFTPDRSAGE